MLGILGAPVRYLLSISLIFVATASAAHVGHLGDYAGHDHWVAGAALGLAILLGLREALKGRAKDEEAEEPEDAEEQEASA